MLRRHLFLVDNLVAIKGFAINGFAKNSLLNRLGTMKLLSHLVIGQRLGTHQAGFLVDGEATTTSLRLAFRTGSKYVAAFL